MWNMASLESYLLPMPIANSAVKHLKNFIKDSEKKTEWTKQKQRRKWIFTVSFISFSFSHAGLSYQFCVLPKTQWVLDFFLWSFMGFGMVHLMENLWHVSLWITCNNHSYRYIRHLPRATDYCVMRNSFRKAFLCILAVAAPGKAGMLLFPPY